MASPRAFSPASWRRLLALAAASKEPAGNRAVHAQLPLAMSTDRAAVTGRGAQGSPSSLLQQQGSLEGLRSVTTRPISSAHIADKQRWDRLSAGVAHVLFGRAAHSSAGPPATEVGVAHEAAFGHKVRRAYEEELADDKHAGQSASEGMGESSAEGLKVVEHVREGGPEPLVTHVVERTVVDKTVDAAPKSGEHVYGAKYATRSTEEGFGTRMGQDGEEGEEDPALHAVDAEHDPARQPKGAPQGEASYGDDYHTRSSEEGFGTRMGQDSQPDDPKLHETTN